MAKASHSGGGSSAAALAIARACAVKYGAQVTQSSGRAAAAAAALRTAAPQRAGAPIAPQLHVHSIHGEGQAPAETSTKPITTLPVMQPKAGAARSEEVQGTLLYSLEVSDEVRNSAISFLA